MNTERSATITSTDGEVFLARLRESTLPAHKNLESLAISEAIISPELTKELYTRYLALMSRIVNDIEENIFPLVEHLIPDLEQRKKIHLIQSDLEDLSADVPHDMPLEAAGYVSSPAFAMGVMYVIEGSTLGGRVILKNVEKTLGYNEGEGGKYFSGYGAQTGPLWKSFLQTFSNYGANKEVQDDIIAGADFTFTTIYNYLH